MVVIAGVVFESCCTQPTFNTFRVLVDAQASQTRVRWETGMLTGARLSGVWHHACAHGFFSNARWSVDELRLALACLIVERFTNPGLSVLVAVDAGTSDHPGSSDGVCIYALIA